MMTHFRVESWPNGMRVLMVRDSDGISTFLKVI